MGTPARLRDQLIDTSGERAPVEKIVLRADDFTTDCAIFEVVDGRWNEWGARGIPAQQEPRLELLQKWIRGPSGASAIDCLLPASYPVPDAHTVPLRWDRTAAELIEVPAGIRRPAHHRNLGEKSALPLSSMLRKGAKS